MTSVCFYFQVHQPFRIRNYGYIEIGSNHFYEDYEKNFEILNKVADKCYLPTNTKMLKLIKRHNGKFRISYSISGVALEQFEQYRPEVIESFKKLVDTGCVEILSETYYHSLSFLYSKQEFERQVKKHFQKVKLHLGVEPTTFRNTELIFSNEIAQYVSAMGFKGMLCEGVDRFLFERTPNYVYASPGIDDFKLLLKNYKLSDDIAFRFSNKQWEDHPLTSEKFANWVHGHAGDAECINLFMDYETFGEHQWKETGIFNFLDHLPEKILAHPDFNFKTPTEVMESFTARDIYDVPYTTSWADAERDLSAWNENKMQKFSLHKIYSLEKKVKKSNNQELVDTWAKLTTSDHFYYMSTKFWSDGDVHKYFSPYDSPYDAHIFYMNVLSDFEQTIKNLRSTAPLRAKKRIGQSPKRKTTTKSTTGQNKKSNKTLFA
jgi:alpha-amylase